MTLCSSMTLYKPHRSYKTAKYLKKKRIDVLEWPCNSPDLNNVNIIEFVWQKMKTRVQQVHLKTLEELKAVLREVWASFTQNELEEIPVHWKNNLVKINGCCCCCKKKVTIPRKSETYKRENIVDLLLISKGEVQH